VTGELLDFTIVIRWDLCSDKGNSKSFTMHLCKVLEPYLTVAPLRIPRPQVYTSIDMSVLARVDEV